ncbi:MAG TPA: cytochrome c family protein [Paracoccaceae bacterium]|nr:cytochrome c family protein [Paracoccaceae bacterium]
MNSTELNKIAGAAIGALLVFLLLNFFSGMIYGTRGGHAVAEGEEGPVLAYAVEVEAAAGAGEPEEPVIDLFAVLAAADPAEGESEFRACGACHSLEQGEIKVGPPLFDVVGRDIASIEGFSYSDAMVAMEGAWTPSLLFQFIHDPKAVVPGTKMSYAGMDDPADRANLIAYLNGIGGSPVDLTEGIEPLAPAGDAAEAGAETEVAVTGEDLTVPVEGAPGAALEGGTVTGTAPPVVTPESLTQSLTSSLPPDQPDVAVTDVDIVDVGEEDIEVDSTTPLEIDEQDPAEASAADPEGLEAVERPVEEHLTVEGPSDEPTLPAGEAVTIEPGAVAPVPAEDGVAEAAVATLGGDPAAGEKIFRRCRACHRIEEGANAIGPSLYGVVGRDIASVADYAYSDAMAAHEGVWTPELLSQFLADPSGVVPGTKMAFGGLRDEQDRIDLITYLQSAAE